MRKDIWRRLLTAGLALIALIYAFFLVKIILFKYGWTTELRGLNYLPFQFVQDYLHPSTSRGVVLKNILGNLALFIPLGILLPALFKKLTFGKTVLLGFLTSLGFEILQYIVGLGATDIDDLLLNTLGCLAGAALYFGLFLRGGRRLRAGLVSFFFLAAFGFCGLLSLWLYQPGMLPAHVEYENEAVFGALDRESFMLSGVCTGITDGAFMLRPGSVTAHQDGLSPQERYALSDDALIVLEWRAHQFSPNGNIQKTFVSYEAVDPTAAAAALATGDGGFCEIWLDAAGRCQTLVLSIYSPEE